MTKKGIIRMLIILLLIMIFVIGGTYAYFLIVVSGNSSVQANSKKYEIIYRGGTHISGNMQAVASKEDGQSTTVEIGLASGSAVANATLLIKIENISSNLAISGFNWEVYRIVSGSEVYVNSGNFANKQTNDEIPIVTNYQLSETISQFKVYFWIDGNNSNNNVEGGSFEGYIAARTDALTGIVKN